MVRIYAVLGGAAAAAGDAGQADERFPTPVHGDV